MLFRDALGHDNKNLLLGEDFRGRVAKASGLEEIPAGSWWAVDYPFNALAGAVLLYVEGDSARDYFPRNISNLIKSGREDVDFIISFGTNIILIEAKAYTSNDNAQVTRKLDRLRILYDFYRDLSGRSDRPIDFRFLLASPTRPQKLNVQWPAWAVKGECPPLMQLKLNVTREVLQTTRCTDSGAISQFGRKWRIMPSKLFRNGAVEGDAS